MFPNSIPEHIEHEEQRELRAQAIARHRRQQGELFDLALEVDTLPPYPPCPYCGENGRPIEMEDRDDSVGYHSIDWRCSECV